MVRRLVSASSAARSALAKVVRLNKARKERRRARARGNTLCKSGHHRWSIDKKREFDVKQGKLVTVRRCERCGATKATLD